MDIINNTNYNAVFDNNSVYLKHTDTNNNNIIINCADIVKSEHKVIVKYRNICRNTRPDIRYYSVINYKKYITRRINEFFTKFHIVIENKGYRIVNN